MVEIQHISDADAYLYHYTKISTAIDYIFKNNTLRLSTYTNTNDPKETKTWRFDLVSFEGLDISKYPTTPLSEKFSAELKSKTKLACFSTDSGPLTGNHINDIYSRGFAKARMWAQYGDCHRGVCLVFDRKKLLAAMRNQFHQHHTMHGKVHYRNAKLIRGIDLHEYMVNLDLYESLGSAAYLRSHIQQHNRALFFEKLADWRDESEWRIVALTHSNDDLYLQLEDSIVAVVHGDSTNPDQSEILMAMTSGTNIQHIGITWNNSSPWYDYGSFDWIPGKVTLPRRKIM